MNLKKLHPENIENKYLRRAIIVIVLTVAIPLYVVASILDGFIEAYRDWNEHKNSAKLLW